LAIVGTITNRFDVPEYVHWEEHLALGVSTSGAYDFGPERTWWLIHLLTK
jgi:hypothetical protein